MAETFQSKLLILGAGPAGYTAAIYAARAGLSPLLVAGMQPGGQLTITTDVENYPGFAEAVQGPWLMDQMAAQATHCGTKVVQDVITSIDLTRRPFRAVGDSGDVYVADALVIATGAQARWLGIPGEKELGGFGVSACATCDGFFYRGKDVAVIGGGNSATEEALYLSNLARHVTLIHRRDTLRSEKILQQRLFAKPNVSIMWNTLTEEVLADTSGRGRLARFLGGEVFFRFKCCHATRAGGGDGLAENLVLHIAGSEDARDGTTRAAGGGFDISFRIHGDLALEQRGCGRMADGNKNAFKSQIRSLSREHILHMNPAHLARWIRDIAGHK